MKDLLHVSDAAIAAEAAWLRHELAKQPPDERIDVLIREVGRLRATVEAVTSRYVAHAEATQMVDAVLEMAHPEGHCVYPSALSIRADEIMPPEHGFHEPEYGESGQPFRWTGPGRAFFFQLKVDRSVPVSFSLEILGALKPELLTTLVARCESGPLELVHVSRDEVHVFSGILPEAPQGSLTTIQFSISQVTAPSTMGHSEDERLLGVRFSRLDLRPSGGVDSS